MVTFSVPSPDDPAPAARDTSRLGVGDLSLEGLPFSGPVSPNDDDREQEDESSQVPGESPNGNEADSEGSEFSVAESNNCEKSPVLTAHQWLIVQHLHGSHPAQDENDRPHRIKLPLDSPLAQRRFLARGEDLVLARNEQAMSLEHTIAVRTGPLRDVDTTFKAINWADKRQPHSSQAKLVDGEEVSPRTKPSARQMSRKEFAEAFGTDRHVNVPESLGKRKFEE